MVYTGYDYISANLTSDPLVDPPPQPSDTYDFSITPNPILTAGEYYITTKTINDIDGLTCDSFKVSDDTFIIYDPEYSVAKNCFDENDVIINISNIIDLTGNLSNDDIIVEYTITDLTNNESFDIKDQQISFNNGITTLPVDISGFSNTAKDFSLQITKPETLGLSCVNFKFEASLIPEDIKLNVVVDNSCNATNVQVSIDAPKLGDGNYMVSYEVKEIGQTEALINNTITFNGGVANFSVDIEDSGEADYEIILKSSQNDTTPCRTKFDFEVKENFSIGGIPDPPTLEENQTFCLSNFFPNTPKISDIVVTTGVNLIWYEDTTFNYPISSNTPLIDGEIIL